MINRCAAGRVESPELSIIAGAARGPVPAPAVRACVYAGANYRSGPPALFETAGNVAIDRLLEPFVSSPAGAVVDLDRVGAACDPPYPRARPRTARRPGDRAGSGVVQPSTAG